ncbi:MAG: sodium:solute symporter [Cyclonatronaceae bacterium]
MDYLYATGLNLLDLAVIVLYLLLCVFIGIKVGGKPTDSTTYFRTSGNTPWWAVSFSIVATETSMLTVISIPAVAYTGSFVFLQLVFGYIIGRFVVAWLILPSYFKGDQKTAYTFFKERFGTRFQKMISVVFLMTRLLADGVRLFAAAIPIKVITGLDYPVAIAIIAVLTLAYTYYGGLKSVIWIDVLQLGVYLFGAIYILLYTAGILEDSVFDYIANAGKTTVIVLPSSIGDAFTITYTLVAGIFGGAFLSMASHGTDQLIVQRLMACRDLRASQRALIASGFFVLIQITLFLIVGMYLYTWYQGAPYTDLGLGNNDEIILRYVLDVIPHGAAGLFIAGLFAAAMSTLSSSLSALSSSTLFDLFPKLSERDDAIFISRMMMVVWTVIFFMFAVSFSNTENPIVELGLGIAGFTYGALLGAFYIGRYTSYTTREVMPGLFACVIGMIFVISFSDLAWPWFTLTGVIIFFTVSTLVYGINRIFGLKR